MSIPDKDIDPPDRLPCRECEAIRLTQHLIGALDAYRGERPSNRLVAHDMVDVAAEDLLPEDATPCKEHSRD